MDSVRPGLATLREPPPKLIAKIGKRSVHDLSDAVFVYDTLMQLDLGTRRTLPMVNPNAAKRVHAAYQVLREVIKGEAGWYVTAWDDKPEMTWWGWKVDLSGISNVSPDANLQAFIDELADEISKISEWIAHEDDLRTMLEDHQARPSAANVSEMARRLSCLELVDLRDRLSFTNTQGTFIVNESGVWSQVSAKARIRIPASVWLYELGEAYVEKAESLRSRFTSRRTD